MADTFTRDTFAWLIQIARDTALPASAARLAIILTGYVNRGTGDAWPSIPRLASDLGVTENSVRNALKALVAGGHIEIDAGGGRNATNRYRPIVKPFTELQGNNEKPCKKLRGSKTKTLQVSEQNPSNFRAKTLQKFEPEPSEEPTEEPSERESLFAASEIEVRKPTRGITPSLAKTPPDGFEEFWRSFPRKVGKAAAMRAYTSALKGGATPQEITLGAARYAADRDREPDPVKRETYTAHPATWLNAGRWADELTAQGRPDFASPNAPDRRSDRPSVYEMAFAGRGK